MKDNNFKSTRVALIESNQVDAITGMIIECISCPFIGGNIFGICRKYGDNGYVEKSDTSKASLRSSHWKRHHKYNPEKKKYKMCLNKTFKETIQDFKNKRLSQKIRSMKRKNQKSNNISNNNLIDNIINNECEFTDDWSESFLSTSHDFEFDANLFDNQIDI